MDKHICIFICTNYSTHLPPSVSQITVSSGGMLTQKLNVDDLQFEKGTFDGTMAYAQNKVKETDSELWR